MAFDVITYAKSRKYTDETVEGGGAIKGKNCVIDGFHEGTKDGKNGLFVTFKWTFDSGEEETSEQFIPYGEDGEQGEQGKGIKSISLVDPNEPYIVITYDDDTQSQPIEIPTVPGEDGFSPTIQVHSDTPTEYTLEITDKNGTITTPNLRDNNLSNYIPNAEKGVSNGVATLGGTGKIPMSQIPDGMDDIVEVYKDPETGNFYTDSEYTEPLVGESGIIYYDVLREEDGKAVGGLYYRWNGTTFVTFGDALVIGEVTGTAFDGGRGKNLEDNKQNKALATQKVIEHEPVSTVEELATMTQYHADKNIWVDSAPTDEIYLTHGFAIGEFDGELYVFRKTASGILDYQITGSGGSDIQVSTMPEASETYLDKVVQYIGGTELMPYGTNEYFIHGFFYECRSTTTGTYQWFRVPTSKEIQVDILPGASIAEFGNIYQYVGYDDPSQELIRGHFYECQQVTESGQTSYTWVDISPSGSSALTSALTSTVKVGGVDVGTQYPVGEPLEGIIRDILAPTLYPTFTDPSASLSVNGGTSVMEVGSTASKTFTITFNRGTITPAYGTSGYRSGVATKWVIGSGGDVDESESSNVFVRQVDDDHKSFIGEVAYNIGEQPKDSSGNNYDSPYPAGVIVTNTITFEFVDPLYANVLDITQIGKFLVSKAKKYQVITFPAQTVANPEVFDIPASWTVTAVEVENELSGAWEDAISQFTVTDITHQSLAGDDVAYKRYTFNLGYPTGARNIRVKWN